MSDMVMRTADDEAALRIIVQQQRKKIDELEEAIRRLADQDATLALRSGNVTVIMDVPLTDEERETVEQVALHLEYVAQRQPPGDVKQKAHKDAATLRGLLERIKDA